MKEPETLPPCDLVLKGGITSGVVYPRAISRLARGYQIKGVGGTSAGAIAAAFAAAAEYRRQRNSTFEGFAEIERLVVDLATKVGGRTKLEGLLQPQRGTRVPFALLKFLLSASRIKKLLVFLALPVTLLWLAVLAGLWVFDATFQSSSGVVERVEFAASYVAVLIGTAILVKELASHLVREFCSQDYGLCRGYDPGNRAARSPQLTEWIHNGLQRTAGLPDSEPLTFAHLEATEEFLSATGSPLRGKCLELKQRVRLRLVTTSLTHSRPYTLPFNEDKFYFKPDEFLQLFPKSIVDWMLEHGRSESIEITPPNGRPFRVYPLPEHGHLPVVVAVRLSLSMPIILSAVNLYCQDRSHPENQPERVIFTDGGIVSNFPIHFFDEMVPTHPTFGLNLIFAPPNLSQVQHLLKNLSTQGRDTATHDGSPVLADTARCLLEHWDRRPGLGGFLEGIYDTARGWKDTTQLRLPGYRDRIQDIYLDPKREGGVHLSMSPAEIEALARKGEEAMEQLLSKFAPCNGRPSASWKNHVFTRYRITMFLLSQKLQMLRDVLDKQDFQDLLFSAANENIGFQFGAEAQSSNDWKGEWCDAGHPSCPENERRGTEQAIRATLELMSFLRSWDSSIFRRSNLPTPLPTMRMAKEV